MLSPDGLELTIVYAKTCNQRLRPVSKTEVDSTSVLASIQLLQLHAVVVEAKNIIEEHS
jgi:hypothetical protein